MSSRHHGRLLRPYAALPRPPRGRGLLDRYRLRAWRCLSRWWTLRCRKSWPRPCWRWLGRSRWLRASPRRRWRWLGRSRRPGRWVPTATVGCAGRTAAGWAGSGRRRCSSPGRFRPAGSPRPARPARPMTHACPASRPGSRHLGSVTRWPCRRAAPYAAGGGSRPWRRPCEQARRSRSAWVGGPHRVHRPCLGATEPRCSKQRPNHRHRSGWGSNRPGVPRQHR